MGEIFDRYMAGEHHDAWRELTGYSEWIKLPEYLGDAQSIASETMTRVQRNVDQLISRLRKMGYRFGELPRGKKLPASLRKAAREKPDSQIADHLATLVAASSPMPLSIQACFTHVGGVNLCGYHPKWNPDLELDPLVLPALNESMLTYWQRAFAAWRQANPHLTPQTPQLEITLAPSAQAKSGKRGGNPCVMRVGLLIMDDIFINDFCPMSFIGYLREAMHSGGFPGLRRRGENADLIAKLTEGLEAF